MTTQRFFVTRVISHKRTTYDEFNTRDEATRAAADYQSVDQKARYYMSTKPCKNWGIECDNEKITASGCAHGTKPCGKVGRAPCCLL